MLRKLSLFVLALAAFTPPSPAHSHGKQHSHFCEGGGYNLFCGDGLKLKIDKAWYGRIAHDSTSCLEVVNGTHEHPDLAQDCGSSILNSKDTWCHHSENGGCTIVVKDLGHSNEAVPCPDAVTKYLYLEYECLGDPHSGAARLEDMSLFLFVLSTVVFYQFQN